MKMKTCLLISEDRLLNLSRLILILLFSLNINFLNAQECTTPNADPQESANFPWFGNPDYLPAFMDSLIAAEDNPSQNPSISSIVPDIKWRIPIKFWILTKGI